MTKNETRARRVNAIYNKTGDLTFANTLRDRSDKYILDNYGIKIPKKIVARKTYSSAAIERKRRALRKYQIAEEYNFTPAEAKNLMNRSFTDINTYGNFKKLQTDTTHNTITLRKQAWSRFSSKNGELPQEVIDIAELVNKSKNFDDNASYGYAVAFYAFVENKYIDDVIKDVESDKFTESAIYK